MRTVSDAHGATKRSSLDPFPAPTPRRGSGGESAGLGQGRKPRSGGRQASLDAARSDADDARQGGSAPQPALPNPPIIHPAFCDRRLCVESGANIWHRGRPQRWLTAEADTCVTIGLAQTDEIIPWREPTQAEYPPVVRLHIFDTQSVTVARYAGQHIEIAAELLLDAPDARKLAAQLVELASQLDALAAENAVSDQATGSDSAVECAGCGHMFAPDSSPNLVLCWQCDALAAQADEASD